MTITRNHYIATINEARAILDGLIIHERWVSEIHHQREMQMVLANVKAIQHAAQHMRNVSCPPEAEKINKRIAGATSSAISTLRQKVGHREGKLPNGIGHKPASTAQPQPAVEAVTGPVNVDYRLPMCGPRRVAGAG